MSVVYTRVHVPQAIRMLPSISGGVSSVVEILDAFFCAFSASESSFGRDLDQMSLSSVASSTSNRRGENVYLPMGGRSPGSTCRISVGDVGIARFFSRDAQQCLCR